jgi:hypothetical protein
MLWKFNSVYDPKLQLADHARPVKYEMKLPDRTVERKKVDVKSLYVLPPQEVRRGPAQASAWNSGDTLRGAP